MKSKDLVCKQLKKTVKVTFLNTGNMESYGSIVNTLGLKKV